MIRRLRAWLASDSARRVYRTFGIAFVGVAAPGALGWLHGLTEWAQSQGQAPFPDASSLAFLGVAGISAGAVALVNLIVVVVEDATGRGVLRPVRRTTRRNDGGFVDPGSAGRIVLVAAFLVVAVLLLAALL